MLSRVRKDVDVKKIGRQKNDECSARLNKADEMKRKFLFCIGVLLILLLLFLAYIGLFYSPYKNVELVYIGCASGSCPFFEDENGEVNPKEWEERKYVYNGCQSYISFMGKNGFKAIAEECNFNSFSFTNDLEEGHRYICAYEYPLARLEYTDMYVTLNGGKYYNRAKLDKKNYKKETWFIYEIEDIDIGSMKAERELMGLLDLY